MIAAFFDMDLTLLRVNSGARWIRWQRQRGEMTRCKALQAVGWLLQYKLSILDMERVSGLAAADLAGDAEAEMIAKARGWYEEEIRREIAPLGVQAVERHRREGHLVAILSSSTPYVTEPLAETLGIEHVLCTRLVVDAAGRFTGTLQRPACYGAGKVHWAERFARAHDVDLGRSYFYTDSYSDLPMLERVGEARVVNPDTRLRRHARRAGWEIATW